MLQTYGAWGVAVLEGCAIIAMARHIVALHKEQRDEAKHITTALVETRDAMKEQRRALEIFVEAARRVETSHR